MRRFRKLASIVAALVVTAVMGAVACSSLNDSTATIAITGIVIRAETLTSGRGCGTAPSQVFKVAAVVFQDNVNTVPVDVQPTRSFVAANVYDCFTDVSFINLPLGPNGSASFGLYLYLFNADAANAFNDKSGSLALLSTSDPAAAEAANSTLLAGNPTWTTTCTATQLDQVKVLASCSSIALGTAGIDPDAAVDPATLRLSTDQFARADGTFAACVPQVDAGDDADAQEDAGDAEPPSPQPLTFDTVRVRARIDDNILSTADVACGAPYVLSPPVPGHVTLDVGLMLAGAPVAQTTCSASATPGLVSSATCAPIP